MGYKVINPIWLDGVKAPGTLLDDKDLTAKQAKAWLKSGGISKAAGKAPDPPASLLDKAVEAGIIAVAGNWYAFGETKLGQGKKAAQAKLDEDAKLKAEIEASLGSE